MAKSNMAVKYAPICPPKWSKNEPLQAMSFKYLNDAAHRPLHKYQQKISNSWQMSQILPLKSPISLKNGQKEEIEEPISYKYSNDAARSPLHINEKLATIA